MRKIYSILLIASTLIFFACQQEENLAGGDMGYLRLNVTEDNSTNSRAVPDNYKPKQIAVQIVDTEGKTVKETEDWELWKDEEIPLPAGTYTIKASSYNFDGKAAGFDIPYYTGSKEVTITNGKPTDATITCTLANVQVTVKIDDALLAKVESVNVDVDNDTNPDDTKPADYHISFTSTETRSAYFPVTDLFATISVKNKTGKTNTMRQELTDKEGNPVKARDHFTLNIKEAASGSNNLIVTVDPTTHEYSYTFRISTVPTNTVTANAWDNVAYLKVELAPNTNTEGLTFQYREASETASRAEAEWIDVETTVEDNVCTAMLTGLKASTIYEYRLIGEKEEVIVETQKLTTQEAATEEEQQPALYNGDFEFWSQSDETIYPDSLAGNTISFWNTSNPGTTQGIGALGGALNPTTKVTSPVVSGKYAAQLKSAYKVIAFAAASLYTGNFQGLSGMSANMEFGKPFTGRPIALHGYYKYTPVVINHVDRAPEGVTIESGKTMDECSIFIALAKKSFTFNNGDESTFIDYEGDDNIIAYGALPSGAATNETANNGYKEFTIPLQYKESQFGEKPTHIIIVCSASKYGDYMTGGEGSTLYVDNFSLVYEGTPAIWKNK